MALEIDPRRLQSALDKARTALLAERHSRGHWTGELSSSALSTATAVCALQIHGRETGSIGRVESLIHGGLEWLSKHQNADGGWGDTDLSFSNISTTTLCWASFGVVPGADARHSGTVAKSEKWLREKAGGLDADTLARAIIQRYGKDRTFSVPILTMCALSGRFGNGREAWKHVIPLPFELAAFPQSWFAALRLPVVSYALPALIAIGQARHRHAPSRNPLARAARNATAERTLNVLERIQPSNGGFLEATPLTSFVTMSLAASGLAQHLVAQRGVEFLIASVRPDGSWPIDTNLATWVTTLSVNALANDPSFQLPSDERASIREWLLGQQYRVKHPYTGAAPGGWAWTDLPGGVPDADDTAGALLALKNLGDVDDHVREAAALGVQWLLDLQNSDGGMPTFCRGWTNLPFDRSGSDLTAHAIRAWYAWADEQDDQRRGQLNKSLLRSQVFLSAARRGDGSWIPLWFGNQHNADENNPIYATAKTLKAYGECADLPQPGEIIDPDPAIRFFQLHQHPSGEWGGPKESPASTEETALAVEGMSELLAHSGRDLFAGMEQSISNGAAALIKSVESDVWLKPAPIGFYFAKLWYYEKLYPQIFTVAALSNVKAVLDRQH